MHNKLNSNIRVSHFLSDNVRIYYLAIQQSWLRQNVTFLANSDQSSIHPPVITYSILEDLLDHAGNLETCGTPFSSDNSQGQSAQESRFGTTAP